MKELGPNSMSDITLSEIGMSVDNQLAIVLSAIADHGGSASIQDIYFAVESNLDGRKLSAQGKASLRRVVNSIAVERGFVFPFDSSDPGWRISSGGRDFISETTESTDVEEEQLYDDQSEISQGIHDPYNPEHIRVELRSFTVFQVMRKVAMQEINLQPDFQRHIVWDETRQSRLIESMLLKIPLPAFYLDAVDDDDWLVVDGLQRLSTLDRFYNKNDLKLSNLEFLHEIEGLTFLELPRRYQRQIEETHLNFYVIQPGTPTEVKFAIFYRINTGGLFLTPQEIRHALFPGKAPVFLKALADSTEFKLATTNSIQNKRMDDRECVLRFTAFYLTSYRDYTKPNLDGFLSDTMKALNQMSDENLEDIERVFKSSMIRSREVFGDLAFRKVFGPGGRRAPISKSLFEVWSVLLVLYDESVLVDRKGTILSDFVSLMNHDAAFVRAISAGTGNVRSVNKRFNEVEQLLAKVCADD